MAVSTDRTGRPQSVEILGSRLDLLSPADVGRWLSRALADPWDGVCRHIVTLNPEYVMAARNDPGFSEALQKADLATADGAGVAVAARLMYGTRVKRVTGVDLVELLGKESTAGAVPLFLLGAGPGVAQRAEAALRDTFPGADICGTWAEGSFHARDDAEAIRRIGMSRAKALAVAYGAPGQIFWIDRNQPQLASAGVRLVVGVGGALDYLSGKTRRPPALVRRLGMEWLVRLVREPQRWRRQLVLPQFAVETLVEAARIRLHRGSQE